MKPIFCGNFEYDARQSDLERLFRKYGRVERVDMKSGKSACFSLSTLLTMGFHVTIVGIIPPPQFVSFFF